MFEEERAAAHWYGGRYTLSMRSMDEEQPLKSQLPFPYNKDLSSVLTHLNRRTAAGRSRLANDPVTAAYLSAAMRLIERHLGPGAERTPLDPDDENSFTRPLLAFLSQRAVAAEVSNNPHPFPRIGSASTLRATWETTSDFVADLLSFGLLPEQYPVGFDQEMAAGAEKLIEGPDLVKAVHDLAYLDTATVIRMPSFRLMLVAAAAAEDDEVIQEAMAENYQGSIEPWKQLYLLLLQTRGLQLRPGITIDDFANLLMAVTDGLALRTIGDSTAQVIDHEQRRSLLGTAALAVIHGCLERIEDADGMTLEQAVHAKIYDRPQTAQNSACP